LVEDIQHLFGSEPHISDAKRVEILGQQIAQTVASRLAEDRRGQKGTLRMSGIGKGDRQIWYEVVSDQPSEVLPPATKMKFLFGDVWESIMLFLAKEAGHTVTHEQEEVVVNGVVGHMDAVIDGVVVDVKTTSNYAFRKFKDGTLQDNDAFGYYEQLAGYSNALGDLDGAWLAVHKEQGHLALLKAPREDLMALDIPNRIEHLKAVVANDQPPPRCYEDEEMGKSGNRVLGVNCSYCPFKQHCWQDANGGIGLRTFIYAKGPVHFTDVQKEPKDQYEVTF
jgi:hypothetical protein